VVRRGIVERTKEAHDKILGKVAGEKAKKRRPSRAKLLWGDLSKGDGKIFYKRQGDIENWKYERKRVKGREIFSCTLRGYEKINESFPIKKNRHPAYSPNTATINENKNISFASGLPGEKPFLSYTTEKILYGRRARHKRPKKRQRLTIRKRVIPNPMVWPIERWN